MSTRVPAPLYDYSHVYSLRPIDSGPEEPTPKKYRSRLVNKLERLLHPTAESSPANSTTIVSSDSSSYIVDGSQPEECPNSTALRILTWNIWFESTLKERRTSILITTIKSLNPLPDVCCFQECTKGFESQLQQDDWWGKTWAMTKCDDQFAVTGFKYGTMIFVRRELAGGMKFEAKAWFEPFEVSPTGRGLLVLELTPPSSKHPVGVQPGSRSMHSLTPLRTSS